MCIFVPCLRWVLTKLDPHDGLLCRFILTEIIRWIIMTVPIFLTVWRYGELEGYTRFIPDVDLKQQYWLVATCIYLGGSLFIYLPIKLISFKFGRTVRLDYGWRPSIVLYIVICALPCLMIITLSIPRNKVNYTRVDEATTAVVQVIILCLTLTEWMAKIRDEEMTYDLINAMALDFFFAYDVIEFFMLSAHEEEIFESNWLYVTMAMCLVVMFVYIPHQPTQMNENGTPRGAILSIVIGMLLNDIPFIIVRVVTIVKFELGVSHIIYPIKNSAMILFGCTQLYIIYFNHRIRREKAAESEFKERRCNRVAPEEESRDNGVADEKPRSTENGGGPSDDNREGDSGNS